MSLLLLISLLATVLIAVLFFLFILIDRLKNRNNGDDESRMIQEMLQGLLRLEERVDSLETLIIATNNQNKQ